MAEPTCGHRYGPHGPTALVTITVGLPGPYAGDDTVPVHPDVLTQRERLNVIAHTQANR